MQTSTYLETDVEILILLSGLHSMTFKNCAVNGDGPVFPRQRDYRSVI